MKRLPFFLDGRSVVAGEEVVAQTGSGVLMAWDYESHRWQAVEWKTVPRDLHPPRRPYRKPIPAEQLVPEVMEEISPDRVMPEGVHYCGVDLTEEGYCPWCQVTVMA